MTLGLGNSVTMTENFRCFFSPLIYEMDIFLIFFRLPFPTSGAEGRKVAAASIIHWFCNLLRPFEYYIELESKQTHNIIYEGIIWDKCVYCKIVAASMKWQQRPLLGKTARLALTSTKYVRRQFVLLEIRLVVVTVTHYRGCYGRTNWNETINAWLLNYTAGGFLCGGRTLLIL